MLWMSPEEVKLLNGKIIRKNKDERFPAMQDFDPSMSHACDICPVKILCEENNEFDCQVYGMFEGYHFSFETALEWCESFDAEKAIRIIDFMQRGKHEQA